MKLHSSKGIISEPCSFGLRDHLSNERNPTVVVQGIQGIILYVTANWGL